MSETDAPKSLSYKAYAPNGRPIIGTYESLNATAYADVRKHAGSEEVNIEYHGESKVGWDSQGQIEDERGPLYVADDYNIIGESELAWKPYCPGCDEIKKEEDLNAEGYCAACAARTSP